MCAAPMPWRCWNTPPSTRFKNFAVNKAKQYVPVTPDGYVIGDVILFYLDENEFSLVGRAPAIEWVEFHAQYPKPDGGKWDVTVERDERTAMRSDGVRKNYRFQLQGPNAMKTLEKAMGETPPDLKFFNMAHIDIAGKDVIALRHGMAGQPGYELFGPWEDYKAVHSALVEAGKDFGLELVGGRAYSSNTLESGWLPSPLPAFYTGDSQMMKDYRAWASGKSYAGMCSIGGSHVPDSVEGYYLTPWDIGYGHIVKFDHDFVGREALEKMKDQKHKQKVTLALDDEEVSRTMSSMFASGGRAKWFEFPSAVYAMHPFDTVKNADGKEIGVSTWIGYSSNEGKMLSLAMIDPGRGRNGQGSHAGVGRAERRHLQAHRGAARADGNQGRHQPGSLFQRRPHRLCRQLARDGCWCQRLIQVSMGEERGRPAQAGRPFA